MKINILFFLLIQIAWVSLSKTKVTQKERALKQTIVTYYIDEQKGENDAITFSLQILQKDASLIEAIEKASEVQKEFTQIFNEFCENNNQDNCQQKLQSSRYTIRVDYYRLRGKEVFKSFVIKFKMTFTISSFELIGVLMDEFGDLLSSHNIIIGEISWEDTDEKLSEEEILEQGVERAKSACEKLDMDFVKIRSVDVWLPVEEQKPKPKVVKKQEEEGEQQQEEEQEQEQQETQQQNQLKYKFTVKCREPKRSPKSKQGKKKDSKQK